MPEKDWKGTARFRKRAGCCDREKEAEMKIRNQARRRALIRAAAAGALSLTLAFGGAFGGVALAGPADDITLGIQAPGPSSAGTGASQTGASGPAGSGQAQQGGQGTAAADLSFYNQTLTDPIVRPVDGYSYDQMLADLTLLAARYPGQISLQVIGQSLDGRDIYDVIVGNPSASKKVLIQGAIHAREYIVIPLIMQQIEYLLAGQQGGGTYQGRPLSELLSQVAIHFVPVTNPDGVTLSQMGESGIRSPQLRQIIQTAYVLDTAEGRTQLGYDEYLRRWKANARGVDLNYNFDAEWNAINPALIHASSNGFRGTSPLSEPESQALASLVTQNAFSAVVSYHAMGRVLYWDTQDNLKAAESYEMAQGVAAATGYSILGSKGRGGLKDWAQKTQGIPSVTIEVGQSMCPVAFSEYPAIWDQNKAVAAYLASYVLSH